MSQDTRGAPRLSLDRRVGLGETSPGSMDIIERLKKIRHLALDLDGTVYQDQAVFEATMPFLSLLGELQIGRTFVTNNSSRSTREYVEHLARLGIQAQRDAIYSSTQATLEYLREEMPSVRRLYVLGTESLRGEFAENGYLLCGDHSKDQPKDEPEAVVVGFDTELTYSRLCQAAYWISRGKIFLATHPDRVCPTGQPTILVDCGSICAALEQATGRKPVAVPGKPHRRMLEGIRKRHGLERAELAMVGDRLYTDMAMARAAGILGILVLTGETTLQVARVNSDPPDLVIEDLKELGALLRRAREVTA